MSIEMDHLDKLGRIGLRRLPRAQGPRAEVRRQYPVPTYVVEFLLGPLLRDVDEQEIAEGLEIVEKQLQDRTVRTGEEELFKARAKERARSS